MFYEIQKIFYNLFFRPKINITKEFYLYILNKSNNNNNNININQNYENVYIKLKEIYQKYNNTFNSMIREIYKEDDITIAFNNFLNNYYSECLNIYHTMVIMIFTILILEKEQNKLSHTFDIILNLINNTKLINITNYHIDHIINL